MAGKRFRFRLEKLLKHRRMLEQQERGRVLQRERELVVEQQKLAELHDEEARVLDAAVPKRGEVVDIQRLEQVGYWLTQIRERQVSQENAVRKAEEKLADQREALRQAQKDVKVLEKLKEQQREVFLAEQRHEEQVFLDDVAGQQFIRRAQEQERYERRQEQGASHG